MLVGQLLQHRGVCAPAGGRLLQRLEPQLLEQDHRQLLGALDVEGLAGQLVDARLQARQLGVEAALEPAQEGQVQADAVALHAQQDRRHRHLQVPEQSVQAGCGQLRFQHLPQAEGVVRVLGRVQGQAFRLHRQDVLEAVALGEELAERHHAVLQELADQVVQAVAAAPRIEHVRGQHRVQARPAQGQTVALEHPLVEFQVLPHLGRSRVRQHRREDHAHRLEARVLAAAGKQGAAGHVAGGGLAPQHRHVGRGQASAGPVVPGQADAYQPGQVRAQAVGLGVDRQRAVRVPLRQPGLEFGVGVQAPVAALPARGGPAVVRGDGLGRGRRGRRRSGRGFRRALAGRAGQGLGLLPHPAQAEFLQQPEELRRGRQARRQAVPVQLQVHVPLDAEEVPRQVDLLAVLAQHPLEPRRQGAALQAGIEGVEAAEVVDQLLRRLVPHPGRPRDVVGLVAGEGEDLHQVGRLQAVLAPHVLEGELADLVAAAAGLEHAGALVQQLHEVLVAGVEPHAITDAGRARGDGRHHVVGLDLRDRQHRQAPGRQQFAQAGQLLGQFCGHGLAVGLVVGIHLVAEIAAGSVEGDHQVPGTVGLDQAQHAAQEAEGHGRQLAAGGGQRAAGEGVMGPVDQGRAVDEDQGHRNRPFAGSGQGRRRP